MRTYPHKPKEKDLRESYQRDLEQYEKDAPDIEAFQRERRPMFFKIHCSEAMDLACLTYAFELPIERVQKFLNEACQWAYRAVEFGVKLDAVLYMKYLSLAILCKEEGFRKLLQNLQRQQYTNPNIEEDEVFYLGGEAMGALSSHQVAMAQEITTKALARLKSGQVKKVGRRSAMEPFILIEAAIANKDSKALASAVDIQVEEFRGHYSPKIAKGYPSGLLDLRATGLLTLAREYGIQPLSSNVYMPKELIEGTF